MPGDRFIELATAEDRHVLDVLFRHANEAVTVQERSGRLLYANDQAAALLGFESANELLAAPPGEVLAEIEMVDRSGAVLPWEALPGRRVMAGEAFVEEIVGYRLKGTQRARWSRVHASPIKNDLGEVALALNFFDDITDQIRSDDAQDVLVAVYEALGSSLDIEPNLQALAFALVPKVGSWCAVHLIDDAGALVPVATVYEDSEVAKLLQLSGLGPISPEEDRLQVRVVRSRKYEIIKEITAAMMDEAENRLGPEVGQVLRGLRLSSVACMPLSVGRLVVGTLTLARGFPHPAIDKADVVLLTAVAGHTAATLENSRLYERQREIAETLQTVLMPKFLPDVPNLELAARYRPLSLVGHVGGDFYDVIPLPDGRCAVLVGDIAGKGIQAAAAVSLARYTLRSTIALDPEPTTVLRQVNNALLEEDRMCTLAYVVLEKRDRQWRLRVTLAGHPPPVVIRADGEMFRVGRPCPPAGVLPHLEPFEEECWLAPGDMAIMYSDGFNLPGLNPPESIELALAKCSRDTPDTLLDQMSTMLFDAIEPGAGVRDDVALLAIRVSEAQLPV